MHENAIIGYTQVRFKMTISGAVSTYRNPWLIALFLLGEQPRFVLRLWRNDQGLSLYLAEVSHAHPRAIR